jgi:hypothetical protein
MHIDTTNQLAASYRVAHLRDMEESEAMVCAELIRDLIKETNALRISGDPEYRAYLRFCAGTADDNLVTMY